ncbi:DUF6153 family protein [Isoptericola croceus]|uniref:DUF6153 family protein n=1 Tax=Isoptericola croceus TaxID=3031406 RepID=UPI0023F83B88|nr:DUF6153 family protein [Isoptericola croceus]
MVSAAATRSGKGLQGFFRCVLLGGLLAVAIIVGLVAMHTLNVHGTPAAHASAAVSILVPDAAHGHDAATHQQVPGGTPAGHGGTCADCGAGDHLGMAMACVLALLLALLILIPPRLVPGWFHSPSRAGSFRHLTDRVSSRAPSLHVLCISRT